MSPRLIGALIAAALVLGLLVGARITGPTCGRYNDRTGRGTACVIETPDHAPHIEYTPDPEEDEPGWNCATMGNHVCGPEATR